MFLYFYLFIFLSFICIITYIYTYSHRLRGTWLNNMVPFDKAIVFHKYIAAMIALLTGMHVMAHMFNYHSIWNANIDVLNGVLNNVSAHTHAHPTHSHPNMHAHAHARTCTHAHSHICVHLTTHTRTHARSRTQNTSRAIKHSQQQAHRLLFL